MSQISQENFLVSCFLAWVFKEILDLALWPHSLQRKELMEYWISLNNIYFIRNIIHITYKFAWHKKSWQNHVPKMVLSPSIFVTKYCAENARISSKKVEFSPYFKRCAGTSIVSFVYTNWGKFDRHIIKTFLKYIQILKMFWNWEKILSGGLLRNVLLVGNRWTH